MDLLRPRKDTGFDRFDAAVLALYAGIVAWAIPHHRNWADEAQAWLIARDSTLHDLLFRRLHYEGAPALWPLLLWVVGRLHLPYVSINWMGGCFAVVGIVVWLWLSPFPRIFRWLIPFTFFLQYQYAVVGRPYTLFPLLIFLMCAVYTMPRPKPLLFALIAGLMANISLHGAITAGCFSVLYLIDMLAQRKKSPRFVDPRSLVAAALLFVVFAGFSAFVAFPAPDSGFGAGKHLMQGRLHGVVVKFLPQEQRAASPVPMDEPLSLPSAVTRKPEPPGPPPSVRLQILARIVWICNSICYPIARSNLLAVATLVLFGLWLWSRHGLQYAIPFLVAIGLSTGIWVYDHHTGMFLLGMVAAAWIVLVRPETRRGPLWIEPIFAGLAGIVFVLQIGWTIHCIRAEAKSPFDPGLATEQFLVGHFPGKRIAGFEYESVSAQPYAPHNLFFNWPRSYWMWSDNVLIDRRRTETALQHPDVVVVGDYTNREEVVFNQWLTIFPPHLNTYMAMRMFWEDHGYTMTHQFCGDRFVRLGISSTFCEDIMEPTPTPSASARR